MAGRICRIILGLGCTAIYATVFAGLALAQGRGGASWNTAGNDAQRTSWVAADPNISPETMTKPGFKLLWKVKVNNDARQGDSLSQAMTVASYIGYRVFRSYAFFGGTSNNAIALDSDLGRVEWTRHFDVPNPPAGTAACPGGMTAGVSRPAALGAGAAGGGGGGGGRGAAGGSGRGGGGRGGAVSAVGQPGEGAVQVAAQAANGGGRGGGGGGRGAAGGSGRGGGGRGAAAGSGRGRGGGRGGGTGNDLFALASDGMLHLMYISNGEDAQSAVRFLPANANATGLTFTENDAFVSTRNNCGGVPNAVWSVNLTGSDHTVNTWKTNGGSVVGTAFGADGTVYASTADGDYGPASFSDSVVALEGQGLKMKDFFTPAKSDFTTTPIVFSFGGKTLVAVANKNGRIYLLDSTSLGGADHKTPLAQSTAFGTVITGDLSTFDSGGTRWILAPVSGGLNAATNFATRNGNASSGAVAAFKVVNQGGQFSLQPAWVSRDVVNPATPAIVNGVVLAVAGGDAQHAAILYALDGSTGKDVWNSGTTMTSYTRSGISGGSSQFYVGTVDSTIYAFGFELVK